MFKYTVLAIFISLLAVNAQYSGWSQTMQFSLYGKNFLCNLLGGGLYHCDSGNGTPATPSAPAAPQAPAQATYNVQTNTATTTATTTPPSTPPTTPPAPVTTPPTTPPVTPPAPVTTPPTTPPAAAPAPSGGGGGTTPNVDLTSAQPLNSPAWNSAILASHNTLRAAMQNTPPVAWDAGLASDATQYANQLAQEGCPLTHSNTPDGENLFGYQGNGCETVYPAIKYMFSECKTYPWNSPQYIESSGHFTQIVWKATTIIGAGAATSPNGQCVIVFRYRTAGNVNGEYTDNVLPFAAGQTCDACSS